MIMFSLTGPVQYILETVVQACVCPCRTVMLKLKKGRRKKRRNIRSIRNTRNIRNIKNAKLKRVR